MHGKKNKNLQASNHSKHISHLKKSRKGFEILFDTKHSLGIKSFFDSLISMVFNNTIKLLIDSKNGQEKLSTRSEINYINMLKKYLYYCRDKNLNWQDGSSVEQYIIENVKENKWSMKYSKLIHTVLSKYAINNNKTKFTEIRKKSYRVVSNRFDNQSFNNKQITSMLEMCLVKESNVDLFILLGLLTGCGLRIVESKQFTVKQIENIFRGLSVEMTSAKTGTIDLIKIHPSYKTGNIDENTIFLPSVGDSVGNHVVRLILQGIVLKDSKNKTIELKENDKLFFKSYESYRSRFKPIVENIVIKGRGIRNGVRNSIYGAQFHTLRRTFGSRVHQDVQSTNRNLQTSVVARALRHTSTSSTNRYIVPNEQDVDDIYDEIF